MKSLTLWEIEEKVKSFINDRDKVVHKGSANKSDYKAVHMQSSRGNYPLCHVRPVAPTMTDDKEEVDCRFCLVVIKEYNI